MVRVTHMIEARLHRLIWSENVNTVRDCNLDTCGVREELSAKGGGDGNRPTYSV
jgi:hypothetical protein